ncbi:S8 family serine peptidase [Actinoplanes sp. KI2]|uniref:S8 family peptidase n=1 Tax=Actinoplanes sp. KI2 TaxID=2983315 RepID=UPI0021D5FCDE|nr:S8 family serine peptidase [Actinoplanes sp. KI2]MCU7722769.1 S8 family serine peptidase [Actinoplanes sp. KI2]
MLSCRFGGGSGFRLELEDNEDLVVIRSVRRGARHDVSPLSSPSRTAQDRLTPLFGFPEAGVGVYASPVGDAPTIAVVLNEDPEVEFAGRGLRDQYGAPVVYTENVFVKFRDDLTAAQCEALLSEAGLTVKRLVGAAPNAYFTAAPTGVGREVFPLAERLLDRDEVELCHPELVREVSRRQWFPQQWHLGPTVVKGVDVVEHAHVVEAWADSRGEGIVVCVIDDGLDVTHAEFGSAGKLVAPRSVSRPRGDDPRPGDGDNHGTACAGVACADGVDKASGVAPGARLMPVRLVSGLGSQDEADAFVWAADHGADVISCSWGPADGRWWDPTDPTHNQVVPLPDNTRLAIEYAIAHGRDGKGCVITWAAGNGAESVDNDGYASYDKVIAVAACNDLGRQSRYSDHGAALWCSFPSSNGSPSRTPGIWTTDRCGREGYNAGDESLGDAAGDYTNSFGGTSSAAPGVAGVAALILSANPGLRWDEVKDLLRASADRIDDNATEYDENGHSNRYGYGRVNAAAAVRLALSQPAAAKRALSVSVANN